MMLISRKSKILVNSHLSTLLIRRSNLNSAYNLLNDIDVEATEAEITSFAKENAKLLKTNQRKAESDNRDQSKREQLEKQAREEKRQLLVQHEKREEEEAAKLKAEVVEALVCPCDTLVYLTRLIIGLGSERSSYGTSTYSCRS